MAKVTVLFSRSDLSDEFESLRITMRQLVDALDERGVRELSTDDLAAYLRSTFVLTPLQLHEDQRVVTVRPNSQGYGRVAIYTIPYDGERSLWQLRPSSSSRTYPPADIGREAITFRVDASSEDADVTRANYEDTMTQVRRAVATSAFDVEQFNESLQDEIVAAITRRKQRLQDDDARASQLR